MQRGGRNQNVVIGIVERAAADHVVAPPRHLNACVVPGHGKIVIDDIAFDDIRVDAIGMRSVGDASDGQISQHGVLHSAARRR